MYIFIQIIDTLGSTHTLPFRVGKIQVPLSINPEGIRLSSAEVQTPTACPERSRRVKSGSVEWVDQAFVYITIPQKKKLDNDFVIW